MERHDTPRLARGARMSIYHDELECLLSLVRRAPHLYTRYVDAAARLVSRATARSAQRTVVSTSRAHGIEFTAAPVLRRTRDASPHAGRGRGRRVLGGGAEGHPNSSLALSFPLATVRARITSRL